MPAAAVPHAPRPKRTRQPGSRSWRPPPAPPRCSWTISNAAINKHKDEGLLDSHFGCRAAAGAVQVRRGPAVAELARVGANCSPALCLRCPQARARVVPRLPALQPDQRSSGVCALVAHSRGAGSEPARPTACWPSGKLPGAAAARRAAAWGAVADGAPAHCSAACLGRCHALPYSHTVLSPRPWEAMHATLSEVAGAAGMLTSALAPRPPLCPHAALAPGKTEGSAAASRKRTASRAAIVPCAQKIKMATPARSQTTV